VRLGFWRYQWDGSLTMNSNAALCNRSIVGASRGSAIMATTTSGVDAL
jgi:hypothetical protein